MFDLKHIDDENIVFGIFHEIDGNSTSYKVWLSKDSAERTLEIDKAFCEGQLDFNY